MKGIAKTLISQIYWLIVLIFCAIFLFIWKTIREEIDKQRNKKTREKQRETHKLQFRSTIATFAFIPKRAIELNNHKEARAEFRKHQQTVAIEIRTDYENENVMWWFRPKTIKAQKEPSRVVRKKL